MTLFQTLTLFWDRFGHDLEMSIELHPRVEFVGYGNVETHWLEDLKPSWGEKAREAQGQRAAAEELPPPTQPPQVCVHIKSHITRFLQKHFFG